MQDDSDNDQGFVVNKITIAQTRPNSKKSKNNSKNTRPLDFQPRYIWSQGLLRKQPQQSYIVSQQPQCFNLNEKIIKHNKNKQQVGHPYQKYFTSQQYKLVYSRSKQKKIDSNQFNFCKNQISLSQTLASYDSSKYSLLKPFQNKNNHIQFGQDQQLQFGSRFQCGNLQWAFKHKGSNTYVLFIQNDTNTYGYNQWFNFSIKNAQKGTNYKFSIVNFKKKHSFFRYGKKLAFFSLKDAENNKGWKYAGNNIFYQKSPIGSQNYKFYSLSFQFEFQHQNDYIMIAMNFPYSYSKLMKKLKETEQLMKKQQNNQISWQMKAVGHSLSNNAVPYLTITSSKESQNQKKAIILLARQHPGQTWSSYLMQAFLKQIVSNTKQSQWLLQNFVFKIFPMVNVDGVIYGNFRCDLGGVDLNRNWKYPSKVLHPQIYAIRQEIEFISQNYQISCCLDFHGHSKQYNTFCYSCKTDNVSSRVLPFIFSKLNQGFHFPFCTFGISKYKQSTARAVIFNIIKNPNVLTIQSSFFGQKTNQQVFSYQPKLIIQMAETLIKGLKQYYSEDKARKEVQKNIKQNINELIQYEFKNGDQAGSESDPSGDEIQFTQKIGNILPKSIITLVQESGEKYKKKPKTFKGNNISINKIKQKQQNKSKANRTNSIKIQPQKSQINPLQLKTQDKMKVAIQKKSIQQKYTQKTKNFETNAEKNQNKFQTIKSKTIKPKSQQKQLSMNLRFENKPNSKIRNYSTFNATYLSNDRKNAKLIPLKFKNQSEQLIRQKQDEKDFFNKANNTSRLLNSTIYDRKLFFVKGHSDQKQQFPQLCILSQGKKKHSYLHSKSKRVEDQQLNQDIQIKKFMNPKKTSPTSTTNRVDMYRKIKDKSKHNAQFLSKIWLQNLTRYGNNMKVFMGGKAQKLE